MADRAQIETRLFAPLPQGAGADGAPRRTGLEIEFAGLTEDAAARIAQQTLGGEIRAAGSHERRVEGSSIGDLKIYLDTRFRDRPGEIARIGLDMARTIVPVEIVTDPLPQDALPHADRLREALREAGAEGSMNAALYGFGLHLNPQIPGNGVEDVLPILTAYALLEDWLRFDDPIDPSRRLLPFSDPYPRGFVDALVRPRDWTMTALIDLYLLHSPTRNRGLDMLPIFAGIDRDRVAEALGGLGAVSPRPAFHYRLPDSRVDNPGWTIAYEWNRWITVERLALDDTARAALVADWTGHREAIFGRRSGWSDHVAAFLGRSDLCP